MKTVKFLGEECTVVFGIYASTGNTSIQLFTLEGEPMAKASLNVGDTCLPENQAYIKDYSENSGMLKTLTESGIVEEVLSYVILWGVINIPLCRINKDWGKDG